MTKKTFADFDLDPRLCKALADDGIEEPFPIQELTLPVAIDGHDVIGQARTGSGKTFGFGLPALHRVDESRREVQVLVVTPTRELTIQVTEDFEQAARHTDIRILSIYGGVPIDPQTDTLRAGVHVVVGTPGRLLDHVRRGNLDLSTCETLILDEADEMLDMGFLPDVEQLISKCAEQRHTMLFSATMPTAVVNLARRYMDRPTFIRAEVEQHTIPDRMEQHFFLVHKLDKPRILARILQSPERGLAVVFTRTKAMADRLVDDLQNYEINAVAIHGDLRQATREKNMGQFKAEDSKQDVLVATEVAARGLDIDELTHVINYDPPEDEKMYLHRIGRTARAGGKGVAVTFATFAEVDRLNAIRKELGLANEPIEETFSTSDVLTQRFDLPAETPWGHLRKTGGSGRSSSSKRSSSKASSSKSSSSKSSSGTSGSRGRNGSSARSTSSDEDRSDRSSRSGSRRAASASGAKTDRPGEASEKPESMDGSTPARTRTRSRSSSADPSSSSGSSSRSSTRSRDGSRRSERSSSERSPGTDRDAGNDTEDAAKVTKSGGSSGSSSGRKRARARRSSSGGGGGKSDGGDDGGKGRDGSSSRSRDTSGRGSSSTRSSSDRGGGSSKRSSSRSSDRDRGSSNRGGSRGGNDDNRRNDGPAEPVHVTTVAGDDARGNADPGIVRQVKVEHLP